jgi:NodT family efflux transporter outer membrane factor (OMF) lipoprotein
MGILGSFNSVVKGGPVEGRRGYFRVLGLMLLCLGVSGCALPRWAENGFKLGPDYETPFAAVGNEWIENADPRVISQPPRHAEWWKVFNDPELDALIERAYRQNLTLREAGLRVLQARAQRAIVVGNLFPQTQQATGDFEREEVSFEADAPFVPSGLRRYNDWKAGLNLSWELDIWGKFRRAIESADASLEASVQDYDAILVSLVAEVATAYTEIRIFEERLEYARQNVEIQEGSLELATDRAEAGATSDVGESLAKSSLDSTRSSIPVLETGLRQTSNRLCTLLGIPPEDLVKKLDGKGGIPVAPSAVSVGIPADLLRRRPDVREAAAQVAAQSARIGIAESELYPSFVISGEIFLESAEFSNLFNSRARGGSVGPSFSWNILNYGRLVSNVRAQELRALELVESYKSTVLSANQEVEDALVSFLKTREQAQLLASSVAESKRSLDLLLIQFEEGKIEFSPVFFLQGILTSAEDQLAAAEGKVATSLIDVYKALGGGWEIRLKDGKPPAE